MRFIALYKRGAIMTDDYSETEILRGEHIKNLEDDIKFGHIKSCVKVYDENYRYICTLNDKKVA